MVRTLKTFSLLIALLCASTGHTAGELRELRDAIYEAESLQEQQRIVEQIHGLLRQDSIGANDVNGLVYALSRHAVFSAPQTKALLDDMIVTPELGEATANVIAGQFSSSHIDQETSDRLAGMLHTYHDEHGLTEATISRLQSALNKSAPQFNRENALDVLLTQPEDLRNDPKFLRSVARLLQPEISLGEKHQAIRLLTDADVPALPDDARIAVYRIATQEPDHRLRVSAWPLLLRQSLDNESRAILPTALTSQLLPPTNVTTFSFLDADTETRERAVTLLIDLWHPRYSPRFIDALIGLVEKHGSPASIQKLAELRRVNGLIEHQLATLDEIAAADPELQAALDAITAPVLVDGSLIGPLEAIEYSDKQQDWAKATAQLLQQYAEGPVPMSVAEPAYKALRQSKMFDVAAAELVLRGDEPVAARQAKVIKLVERGGLPPDQTVALLQRLHDDADVSTLFRHYTSDGSVSNDLRGTLMSLLYREVRETGNLDADTAAAIIETARIADSSYTVGLAINLLEKSGNRVPWSLRVRQTEFQWSVMGWFGLLSLVVAGASSLAWLAIIMVPSKSSGLSGAARIGLLVGWLLLAGAFVIVAIFAFVFSLGHNTTPPVGQAAPFYAGGFGLALLFAGITVYLYRRRPRLPDDAVAAATG